jgi:two-component system nitrogen regulation response regulator GlnG
VLFLDEVADIPLPTQVKLLRVLEQGEFLPVGHDRPVRMDFRVISATHRSLVERMNEGLFRHDLYFRLCGFQIEMPPLRERRDDIRMLAEHFVGQLTRGDGARRPRISAEALAEWEGRPWYGNVRELRNAIEHALVLARWGVILPEHLAPPAFLSAQHGPSGATGTDEEIARLVRGWAELRLSDPRRAKDVYDQLLRVIEPSLLEVALAKYRGQCAPAARSLGLHRTTLRKMLARYGIGEA